MSGEGTNGHPRQRKQHRRAAGNSSHGACVGMTLAGSSVGLGLLHKGPEMQLRSFDSTLNVIRAAEGMQIKNSTLGSGFEDKVYGCREGGGG